MTLKKIDEDEQHVDAHLRIEHEVRAEHARDRARRADRRHRRRRLDEDVRRRPRRGRRGDRRARKRPGPMLSSMLLPKTQKNSALPSRCPQPPCRNIEVSGVKMLIGRDRRRRRARRRAERASPQRARWVSSPGTIPKLQMLVASAGRSRQSAALHDDPDGEHGRRGSARS